MDTTGPKTGRFIGFNQTIYHRGLTAKDRRRSAALLPGGIPRYLRVYDNGGTGEAGGSFDRYTVVFSGRISGLPSGWHPYLGMSESPTSPQGFGQHGENHYQAVDTVIPGKRGGYRWPPAIGRKCHLGQRRHYLAALPLECRKLAIQDYCYYWDLALPARY